MRRYCHICGEPICGEYASFCGRDYHADCRERYEAGEGPDIEEEEQQ